ncbi:uncharacterized protein [Manis javanica]|uniref:uncharacterized protein n=1 Tax=Manis javanica TaxID=9974 RepID=UPI00187B0433|nr:uncharacterized protein LOC108387948 isoform X1 [Manis javanica]
MGDVQTPWEAGRLGGSGLLRKARGAAEKGAPYACEAARASEKVPGRRVRGWRAPRGPWDFLTQLRGLGRPGKQPRHTHPSAHPVATLPMHEEKMCKAACSGRQYGDLSSKPTVTNKLSRVKTPTYRWSPWSYNRMSQQHTHLRSSPPGCYRQRPRQLPLPENGRWLVVSSASVLLSCQSTWIPKWRLPCKLASPSPWLLQSCPRWKLLSLGGAKLSLAVLLLPYFKKLPGAHTRAWPWERWATLGAMTKEHLIMEGTAPPGACLHTQGHCRSKLHGSTGLGS